DTVAHTRSHLTDWLHDQMVRHQFDTEMEFGPSTLPAAMAETARRRPRHMVLQDVTMKALNYKRLSIACDLFARELKESIDPSSTRVGVLLPNVNAMPIMILSLWQIDKIPAVLNFSTGPAVHLACARLAELRQIITS